jgi:hypothetical protein
MSYNVAVVTEVLPARHGVLVAYKNGNEHFAGNNAGDSFVRVLEARAHHSGGATCWLPEVGEVGLVVDVYPGFSVWIGSLPMEGDDNHQMDPRPGLAGWRHQSGVQVVVTDDGDFQVSHPSGLAFTVSTDGTPLPEFKGATPTGSRSGKPDGATEGYGPCINLWHPSGFTAALDAYGNLAVDGPGTLDGHFVGAATLALDDTLTATVVGDVALDAQAKVTATVAGDVSLQAQGTLTFKSAQKVVLDAPVVEVAQVLLVKGAIQADAGLTTSGGGAIPGGINMTGSATFSGATIGGKSFLSHSHSGVQSGGAYTGPPA